ncbi:MAG: MBL fold metallo-hydrolase [Thiotrichales bacterium]
MKSIWFVIAALMLHGCGQEPQDASPPPAAPVEKSAASGVEAPAASAAPAPPAERVYAEATVAMELAQVSPHVYYAMGAPGTATDNQGFISNAGVIITDDGVVVLDGLGTPSLAEKLLGLIREKTDQPIRYAIVTHYHADHIYGLQVFQDAGAKIIAPRGADAYLAAANAETRLNERRTSLFPWVDERTRLVVPDEYIDGERELTVGGVTLRLEYLGAAHSDGDLSLYVLPDKVLFTGDLIFEGRIPFVGDAETRQWLATLQRLEQEQPAALVPGHGPAARDPVASVRGTREYLAYLREQLGVAVANFTPFDEAFDAIDWSAFEKLPAFAEAHRRNAYQVYLALEAEGFE